LAVLGILCFYALDIGEEDKRLKTEAFKSWLRTEAAILSGTLN